MNAFKCPFITPFNGALLKALTRQAGRISQRDGWVSRPGDSALWEPDSSVLLTHPSCLTNKSLIGALLRRDESFFIMPVDHLIDCKAKSYISQFVYMMPVDHLIGCKAGPYSSHYQVDGLPPA
jgi:hypothetical protein